MPRDYITKITQENIAGTIINLETIADLDQAIDSLCDGVDESTQEAIFVQELCPYFGVVWPAARALATHMAQMGTWLKGKKVLEIGCGMALPSLVCAKLGAQVTATDFHPDVPGFLTKNLKHNNLNEHNLQYKNLDWRLEGQINNTFDFVIGSDILYESDHPTNVAKALAQYCHKESHIILADPGRAYLQACVDAICAKNFRNHTFIQSVLDFHSDRAGDRPTKEVFVIVLQKK